MVINFLDTSAILNGGLDSYSTCYMSPITLMELEHIKDDRYKDDNVKYRARQAVKKIIDSLTIEIPYFPQKKLDRVIKKYNFLSDINDHKILAGAELLGEDGDEVTFITSDGAQFLFAKRLPHINAVFFNPKAAEEYEYCGWGNYCPSDSELNTLYTDPAQNILGCKTNEFAKIYVDGKIKDVLFWNGEKYRVLKYKEVRDKTLGESIKPRNLEQKMAFDLLQNPDIPVKLLVGNPGTGKDLLMIMHAIDLIQRGDIDKIIFVRNLVPFKDAPEIGFLSGNMEEKISWGLGPLRSILGEEGLMMYEESGAIEAVNLGFIRGCSWDRTIIYVSEGQNITGGGYKLLISRCGQGSQLWVNGDILQTDDKKFEQNNGLNRLTSSLAGNKLFGVVKLLQTERSVVADLASQI